MVPEQAPLIILDRKSAICMVNNGKDTKHTIHTATIMHLVRNGEERNMHKQMWCETCLQLVDIGAKNVREDELNPRLGYAMVILDNLQNNCQRGVTGYRIFLGKIFS